MSKYKPNNNSCYLKDEEIYKDEEEKSKVDRMPEIEREGWLAERIAAVNERKQLHLDEHIPARNTPKKRKKNEINKQDAVAEDGEINDNSSDYDNDKKKEKDNLTDEPDVLNIDDEDNKDSKDKHISSIKFSDLEKIKVSRKFFEKYLDFKVFNENIKDAFVRLNINWGVHNNKGIGNVSNSGSDGYLLCQIKAIKEYKDKPYRFNDRNCTKYLVATHANQEKEMEFNFISNSNITENEFTIWKSHMINNNLSLVTEDEIKKIAEKINSISKIKYYENDISSVVNKNIEEQIKNKDKSINVTYHLELLTEQYNSAKDKYKETKEEKYKEIMENASKEIKSLMKMKEEREKIERQKEEHDVVAIINKKRMEKQRQIDLLNKKRKNHFDPYERVCDAPSSLYDAEIVKVDKNENKEEKEKKVNDVKEVKMKNNGSTVSEGMMFLNKVNKYKKNLESINEDIENKMNIISQNNSQKYDEKEMFFNILNINVNTLLNKIKEQNEKLSNNPNVKHFDLSNYE